MTVRLKVTGELVGLFRSIKKASQATGLHESTVSRSLSGRENRKFLFSYIGGMLSQ